METMFRNQQLLGVVADFIKPALVLPGRGPQDLHSGVVDQPSEGRPVCLHILAVRWGGFRTVFRGVDKGLSGIGVLQAT